MLLHYELLYATLAFTFICFLAVLYVVVRNLAPLLPPHVLSRWSRNNTPLPLYGYAQTEKQSARRKRLKSAQRFQCWLALVDLAAAGVWLWEVVALATVPNEQNSPARIAFAVSARTTVLVIVSLLSYLNVVRGKSIDLGRFDVIVWVPSLVLSALVISLTSVAKASCPKPWIMVASLLSSLICSCTWCFGRLLLAVYRVRRATLKNQMLRDKVFREEKLAHEADRLRQIALRPSVAAGYLDAVCFSGEDTAFCRLSPDPPILPPFKTSRWLISKTFLFAKASSAAHTVAASLHRRSASGARPSMASENTCPALHFDTAISDGTLGFLQHDPTTSTCFSHLNGPSNGALSAPTIELVTTSRGITFSPEARPSLRDAHVFSPHVDCNAAALRATDRTRTLQGDEPRPSFASCVSSTSSDDRTSFDHAHIGSYLTVGTHLYPYSMTRMPRTGYQSAPLGRKEARKAGIRMGGHLISCVVSWMLVIPFLAYKIHDPTRHAPWATSLLVAMAVCLGGPLLAIQTVMAEGLWFKTDRAPHMASSSAVAFEHLASRLVTPLTTPLSAQNLTGTLSTASNGASQSGQLVSSARPKHPDSVASSNETTNQCPSRAASRAGSHHRSTGSNGSMSASSLASLAAFSHPPQGIIRHSLDTVEAPTNIFARALHMAAPHPKLQVISRRAGDDISRQCEGNLTLDPSDNDRLRKEAQRLKSFTMTERLCGSIVRDKASEKFGNNKGSTVRHSILGDKDTNSKSAGIKTVARNECPRSPGSSITARTSSVYSTASEFSRADRRRSAPASIMSSHRNSRTGSCVFVHRSATSEYQNSEVMAAMLAEPVPNLNVSKATLTRAYSTRLSGLPADTPTVVQTNVPPSFVIAPASTPATTAPASAHSSARKPNISLSIQGQDSRFADAVGAVVHNESAAHTSSILANHNGYKRHLRHRSRAQTVEQCPQDGNSDLHADTTNIIHRSVKAHRSASGHNLDHVEHFASRPSTEGDTTIKSADSAIKAIPDMLSVTRLPSDTPQNTLPDFARIDLAIKFGQQGIMPTSMMYQDDAIEEATITTAHRVHRALSRASLSANVMLQRVASTCTIAEVLSGEHNRSSSLSSMTSPGFANMISSNRNSWTDSTVDFTDIHRLSEASDTVMEEVRPLAVRSQNKQMARVDGDKKAPKGSQMPTTMRSPVVAAERGYSSPRRTPMSAIRGSKTEHRDSNAPEQPASSRSKQASAAFEMQPMIRKQTSILSLR